MHGLILANGEPPSEALCKRAAAEADRIYCCDGACGYAGAYGILPHVLLGDMDSLLGELPAAFAKIPQKKFPAEKDATDLQLAVELALEEGCTTVEILGGTGRRTDHLLGNLQLLLFLAHRHIPARLTDDYNTVSAETGHITLAGEKGDLVSVIPLSQNVYVTTKNLKYPLRDHLMPAELPLGISNELLEREAGLEISGGYALIVRPHRDRPNK